MSGWIGGDRTLGDRTSPLGATVLAAAAATLVYVVFTVVYAGGNWYLRR